MRLDVLVESYSTLHRTRVWPPQVVFVAKHATPIGEEKSCACITALSYLLRPHTGTLLSFLMGGEWGGFMGVLGVSVTREAHQGVWVFLKFT